MFRRFRTAAAILLAASALALLPAGAQSYPPTNPGPQGAPTMTVPQTSTPMALPQGNGTISIILNGQPLALDRPPLMLGNRVLVPMRGIFEHLGAAVSYNPANHTINAVRGSTNVLLTLGSPAATVNGNPVTLDVPAEAINDRTMVPLRFVAESLGAEVHWMEATQTVTIAELQPVGLRTEQETVEVPQPPTPPPQPMPQPPQIHEITTSCTNGQLLLGDSLTVDMTGDPGGQATFEMPGVLPPVAMREVQAGHYEGSIVLPETCREGSARLQVHLELNGLTASDESPAPVQIMAGAGANDRLYLTVLTPRADQVVRSDFVVSGRTQQFAHVKVIAQQMHSFIWSYGGRKVVGEGVADVNGHFAIPIHLERGQGVDLRVQASNNQGVISKEIEISISTADE